MIKDYFIQFLEGTFQDVPVYIYEFLLVVFFVGLILVLSSSRIKKKGACVAGLLLAEYIALLYMSMVLFRPFSDSVGYDFHLFWSYVAIYQGRIELIPENVMNVVVFVPVGLLLGCAFRSMNWWKIILIGVCLSVSIEAMQFFLKKGFAETDDVMHNILGCMIGYGIYSLTRFGNENFSKRPVAVL